MRNYVKNERGYKKIQFDTKAIQKAYQNRKSEKKYPTSISLSQNIVLELKDLASKKGVPYQTLMRMLIVDGLEKLKKAA